MQALPILLLAGACAAGSACAAQAQLPCASLAGRDIPAAAIGLPTSGAAITAATLVMRSSPRWGSRARR